MSLRDETCRARESLERGGWFYNRFILVLFGSFTPSSARQMLINGRVNLILTLDSVWYETDDPFAA
jgi:hypothetical protein